MSLINNYNEFRRNPKVSSVTNNAIMAYISSGLEFSGPEEIVSHLLKDKHEVNKVESIISQLEANNSLVLEMDTTIEFVRGSGALIPGLSSNLVVDEKVSAVVIHIISFNEVGQISGVKYIWDQATILKQLNVIGHRGNAWPICNGDKQTKISKRVQQGVEKEQTTVSSNTDAPSSPQKQQHATTTGPHLHPETHASPMRSWPDSVNLFNNAPLVENIPIPTRALEPPSPSAKPPPRTINQILDTNSDGPARRQQFPAKSAYASLFGGDDDDNTNTGYTRVIGGGGGGYGDSKKGLKPSWHWGDEDKEN